MQTLFLVCVGFGGGLLLCQLILGLFGIGEGHSVDHDVGADHDMGHSDGSHSNGDNWLFGLLTFRSITSAIAFFGLGGLTALYYKADQPFAITAAFFCGGGSLYFVAWLMNWMHRLRSDGTIKIANAVGQKGSVYLRVPGNKTGPGKITIEMQNRTVEFQAVTAFDEIKTGTPVRVIGVIDQNTVEVAPAEPVTR